MSDETWDDAPCTDCGDTGITYQTERVCSCLAGLAIEMIDADACPSPTDLISSLEAQLLAAERERDALREALQETDDFIERVNLDERMCCSGQYCGCRGSTQRDYLLHNIRAALTANHSAPQEQQP